MNDKELLQETILSLLTESKVDYKDLVAQVDDSNKDKETIEYFKEEIQKGNHEPILLNSQLEVIDGNHRLKAYQELNIEPPLLYQGERKDFYSVGQDANYDGIEMIKLMIEDGTAIKI